MRAFLAWTGLVAISILLGVALYSTSLQGSTVGYHDSFVSPRPVPTVIQKTTKIVRKPAKTKLVYVTPAPAAPAWTPSSNPEPSAVRSVPGRSAEVPNEQSKSGDASDD